MSMQGGIMDDQTQAERPLIVPFASLPDPTTVPGQVRTLSDVPGVEVVARDIWRPRGGRQVLAMRTLNPVTVQDLAGAVAETIGPFPGGLVRAGMQLQASLSVDLSAITNTNRIARVLLGNTLPIPASNSASMMMSIGTAANVVNVVMDGIAIANVRSDTVGSRTGSRGVIGILAQAYDLAIDVSQPWYGQVWLQSAAETAVAIASSSWVGGVATYNTSAVHTLAVGDKTTIAGVSLAGYNGVVIVASVVDTDTFTVAMASNPGGAGTGGTSSRISNMISQSYVLELVG